MDGPSHYAEAERLLADLDRRPVESDHSYLARRAIQRDSAQVHATLALAAATATSLPVSQAGSTSAAWGSVLGLGQPTARPQHIGSVHDGPDPTVTP